MHTVRTPVPTIAWVAASEVPRESYWVHDEHFPDPLSPLYADFGPGNLSDDSDLLELASPIPTKQRLVVDGYLYTGVRDSPAPVSSQSIARFEEALRQRKDREVIRRWFEETRPAMLDRHAQLCQVRLSDLDTSALLRHIRQLADDTRAAHRAHALNVRAVSLITRELEYVCVHQLGRSAVEYQELLAGSSETTVGPVAAMEDLARQVAGDARLQGLLSLDQPWLEAEIRTLLQPYVVGYGHRLLQPDFFQPTLAEQPDAPVNLLREAIARLDSADGAAASRSGARAARKAADLRTRLTSPADLDTFDGLLAEARRVDGVREEGQAFLAALRGFLRYALLEAGRRLMREGVLDAPEQVWFLRRGELEDALGARPSRTLRAAALERSGEHRQQRDRVPPRAFGSPPAPVEWPPIAADTRRALDALGAWTVSAAGVRTDAPSAEMLLSGMGASRGTATGPARVISGPDQFHLVQPGDVLICKISSPAWTIIFGRIRGIVTEVGSVLSHPAIAAREFGIPAVLGVSEATTRIRDGQLITVDGTEGVVRIAAGATQERAHE